MRNGRKKPLNAPLEFAATQKETFARMYASLTKSRAYRDLTLGARQFYCVCRVHAASPEGRRLLAAIGRNRRKDYDFDMEFAFPTTALKEYGYSNAEASRYFKQLEKAGFVSNVERYYNRSANIWRFVSKWHQNEQK